MKIIAFPYAGGNKYSYNFLKPYLEKNIRFEVFEYAGRGNRISEKPLDSIDAIVDDLWPHILKVIKTEEPYAFYGHSMGALVGYLLCHRIQEKKLKEPQRLIISGRKAPRVARDKKIWNYPRDQFWKELIDLGGIPKEMQEEASLRDFFEPIIKADFKSVEQYSYNENQQLNIPIDVLYGDEEKENENDFTDWMKETKKQVSCHSFKGNHFFIHNYAQDIANYFVRRYDGGRKNTHSYEQTPSLVAASTQTSSKNK